ncbi:MAG TPA: IS110 family transposase [Acidimicrobiales bacterium]|nr:IS110 family transposase [Acidimicrobiales bacterium]
MDKIRGRVAGLDVHKKTVVACALTLEPDGSMVRSKASFSTTSSGLAELAGFLDQAEVSTVAMEATGVYWKPVYYSLEGMFDELWLCNAHHVKNVPGRKTDMSDAEWLADVAAHGMVRPSFVPPPEIRELRELTRYRKTQISERGREIQRLEKVLQDAGIKLSSVTSRVWGVSTRQMIEALIAGEKDPETLAEMARSTMRAKRPQLAEALSGRFGLHHATVARQIIAHIDFLDASIAALSADIASRVAPFEQAVKVITSVPGIATLTAEMVIAELGVDMSHWPTGGHCCAWGGLAPASHESAGKRKPVGTRQGGNWLRKALIEAAWASVRSPGTYHNALFKRIARRRGPNKAIVAVAHSMLNTIWHLLSTGELYQDPGADYFDRLDNPAREAQRLTRRLETLGYTVTITPAA